MIHKLGKNVFEYKPDPENLPSQEVLQEWFSLQDTLMDKDQQGDQMTDFFARLIDNFKKKFFTTFNDRLVVFVTQEIDNVVASISTYMEGAVAKNEDAKAAYEKCMQELLEWLEVHKRKMLSQAAKNNILQSNVQKDIEKWKDENQTLAMQLEQERKSLTEGFLLHVNNFMEEIFLKIQQASQEFPSEIREKTAGNLESMREKLETLSEVCGDDKRCAKLLASLREQKKKFEPTKPINKGAGLATNFMGLFGFGATPAGEFKSDYPETEIKIPGGAQTTFSYSVEEPISSMDRLEGKLKEISSIQTFREMQEYTMLIRELLFEHNVINWTAQSVGSRGGAGYKIGKQGEYGLSKRRDEDFRTYKRRVQSRISRLLQLERLYRNDKLLEMQGERYEVKQEF